MNHRPMAVVALLFAIIGGLSFLTQRSDSNDATIAAFVNDPQRLQAALRECRRQIAPTEDPACRAAMEAWRRHFFGRGVADASSESKARVVTGAPAPGDEPLSTEPPPWLIGP